MPETRDTRYAPTPDGLYIAYQAFGSGPDLVAVIGGPGDTEAAWAWPALAQFMTRLASFTRLIRLDNRGTGQSDPVNPDTWGSLEAFAQDILAVLDELGVERTALLANNISGSIPMFFAATYPDRVSALILDGCYARFTRDDDYPMGLPHEILQRALDQVGDPERVKQGDLGTEVAIEMLAPSYAADDEFIAHYRRVGRASSPGPKYAKLSAERYMLSDVRPLLGSIRAPTLVLCRADDQFAGPRHSEYLAQHIAGAKLVVLPGRDNLTYIGDTDAVLGEIEEFLTGVRHQPEFDRVLATVLFTDIVGSTDRAAEVGDRRWRDLLDRHDAIAREEIERLRGQFVKSTGDGIVATFDGPARGIRCAQAITRRTADLGLDVRSGLHTGEIEQRGDDVHGLAVHVAQRVSALAGAGEVLVSRTVVDLVAGSDIQFEDHGEHELKGVPGTWKVALVSA